MQGFREVSQSQFLNVQQREKHSQELAMLPLLLYNALQSWAFVIKGSCAMKVIIHS